MRAAAVMLFLETLFLETCLPPPPDIPPPPVRTVPAPFAACSAGDADAYDLEGHGTALLEVEGDALRVNVTHGGGCEEHAYQICWPSGAFDGSDPAGATLEVWHDSKGDMCAALVSETLSFDLAPLRDAWHGSHGPGAGSIRIQVGRRTVDYTFDG